MVLLDDGQIVEVNEPAAFFSHPQHERTKPCADRYAL